MHYSKVAGSVQKDRSSVGLVFAKQQPEKEMLVQFCIETLKREDIDYFVFGHRHLALEYPLPGNKLYVNLGDWIRYDSYGEFDGETMRLKYYKQPGV